MNKNEPNYERYVIVGLILALFTFVSVSYYWFGESARLAHASGAIAEERVRQGRSIYLEQCALCHGERGEGGVGPALNDKSLLKNTLDEVLFSVIRSGVPNTQMPVWSVDFGGPLTDEGVRDLVAFIRAWEPTAPEIQPQVFEPDSSRGALLYATTCETCHGENGRGTARAPAINDSARLATLDDSWYRAVINYGRPARGMPTWGAALSPDQIEDLIALIQDWREGITVKAAFSAGDLIEAAIFAMQEQDPASAAIHVSRALTVARGKGGEMLQEAATQQASGDDAGTLATLKALQAQWPIGDAAAGTEKFTANCSACHGARGWGGVGPPLRPNEFVQKITNAELLAFILEGRAGTAMAGFESRLSEDDIADLIALLRTWQP